MAKLSEEISKDNAITYYKENPKKEGNNLASLLSGIFGAIAGQSQQDQTPSFSQVDPPIPSGTLTNEGISGPVAKVKEEKDATYTKEGEAQATPVVDRWQDPSLNLAEVTKMAAAKQYQNAIGNIQDPQVLAQMYYQADGMLQQAKTFANSVPPLTQTQQDTNQVLDNAATRSGRSPQYKDPTKLGLGGYLKQAAYALIGSQSPEYTEAQTYAEAQGRGMGGLVPNVAQTAYQNQLPLSTVQQVQSGIDAYNAQVSASKGVLENARAQQEALNKTITTEKDFRGIGERIKTWATGKPGKRISSLLESQAEVLRGGYGSEGAAKNLKELANTRPATSISEIAQQKNEKLMSKIRSAAPEMAKKGYKGYNFTTNQWVK